MKLWIIAAVALLVVVTGCAPIPAAGPGITIAEAFARPAPSEGGNGGVFMTIANGGGAADRLVGGSSPVAKAVEIHETIDDNGVMKMRPVPGGFEVPAGGTLELKPGGKHIMLIGLAAPLAEGQEIELTLMFEKAGEITVKAPVKMMQMQ